MIGIGVGLGTRHRRIVVPSSWWLATGIPANQFVAVYQPKGAASLEASYINLANPGTYDITPHTTAPALVAEGWQFAFLGERLFTGILLGIGASVFIQGTSWVRDASTRFVMGAHDGTRRLECYISTANSGFGYGPVAEALVATGWNGTEARNLGIANNAYYLDGVKTAAALTGLAAPLTRDLWIGCSNRSGTATSAFKGARITALVILNTAPTDPQALALAQAMAAL